MPPDAERIVETALMRSAIRFALGSHGRIAGFHVWSGLAGMGKSTAARYAVQQCETGTVCGVPVDFRAEYVLAPEISRSSSSAFDDPLWALYSHFVRHAPRRSTDKSRLAIELATYFQSTRTAFLFIDEAGQMNHPRAFAGLTHLLNTAATLTPRWMMSIVLVGMNNLPALVTREPQVESRILNWFAFKAYTETHDVYRLLATSFPEVAALDAAAAATHATMQALMKVSGGSLRGMVGLVQAAKTLWAEAPLSASLVEMAHQVKVINKKEVDSMMRTNWVP